MLFIGNYVFESYEGGAAICEMIPELLSTAAEESPLRCAFSAVGSATLASRAQRSSDLMLQSSKEYHLALCRLNKALQFPDAASQDDTLATVCLLGLYEIQGAVSQTQD